MSRTASIQFAPIDSLERINDANWRPGRTMFERRALSFLPPKKTVPLLLDHADDQVIGTVTGLYPMEWPDGWWHMASATLSSNAPSWIDRGSRCSFGYKVLHTRDYASWGNPKEVIARAIVSEISVLSPDNPPAEPCAHVRHIRDEPKPSPIKTTPAPKRQPGNPAHIRRAQPISSSEWMEEVQRRMDFAERRSGRHADMGEIIAHLRREVEGPTIDQLYAKTIGRRVAA